MTDTPANWVHKLRSRFIVFDGPDGSGKSTQFRRFAQHIRNQGVPVCEVREPGGTNIGEQIRKVLLDPANTDIDLRCEMLLYMASRAQLVTQIIRPALQRGELVLADRFISSTLAYQGSAGGLPSADIMRVGQIAVGDHWPDFVIVFDVDEQTASTRLSPLLDRMEQKGREFHRQVRLGYLDQAQLDPKRYIIVDARQGPDDVFAELCRKLTDRLTNTQSNTSTNRP